MQLRNLALNGFRRFRSTDVRLEGPVIAIVGRNEAGKSTILEALHLMNEDEAIPATAISERGDKASDNVITLRLRLAKDEQDEVAAIAQGHRPTWLIVAKAAGGRRKYTVEPRVPAPHDARRACADRVLDVLGNEAAAKTLPRDAIGELKTLHPQMKSAVERLPSATLALLTSLDDRISAQEPSDPIVAALLGSIKAARVEEDLLTSAQVGEHLAPYVPRFLRFEDSVRSLRSTYDLSRDGSRPALANLLQAAGLTAEELVHALDSGDGGRLKSLIDAGERCLTEILSPSWSQDTQVRVGLQTMEKRTLAITATTNGVAFHGLGDRSDGLRSYIALRAFVANEAGGVPPVLLIDEAETHLHYDAQGDLVRMFEEQRDAASVIYTTHSVACLPQDLGRGVRVVIREPDSTESEVSNAWTADGAGVAPLLRAMGAATALLSPSRYLVLGEGPSEPALLPTLFRQALGLRSLPFQVVGRTSSASEDELRRLRDENAKVAFLLDGDAAGDKREAELRAIGFQKRQIVRLNPGYETEDLVEPGLYARAVATHLKVWTKIDPTVGPLKTPGRVDQVDALCDSLGVDRQSHSNVVEEVLRQLEEDETSSLLAIDPAARKQIARIYQRLVGALGISSDEAAVFRA